MMNSALHSPYLRKSQGPAWADGWSLRVLRVYGTLCAVALAALVAASPWLSRVARGAFSGQRTLQMNQAGRILGPVLTDSERAKVSFIRAHAGRRFGALPAASRDELAETIYVNSQLRGVDPLLTLAVIEQESAFAHDAESSKGALGLMQVRPFVGEEVAGRMGIAWEGRPTLLHPATNVRIGINYLAQMKRMYQESELALAAYNLGPYRLKSLLAGGQPLPNDYPQKVLAYYRTLQRGYLAYLERPDSTYLLGSTELALASPAPGSPEGI